MALTQHHVSSRISTHCIGMRSPLLVQGTLLALVTASLLHVQIGAALPSVSSAELQNISSTLSYSQNTDHSNTTNIPSSKTFSHSLHSSTTAFSVSNSEPTTLKEGCFPDDIPMKHVSVQRKCHILLRKLNISEERIPRDETQLCSRTFPIGNFSLSVGNVSSILREDDKCKCKAEQHINVAYDTCALSMNFTKFSKRRDGESQRIAEALLFFSGSSYVKVLSLQNNNITNFPKGVFKNFINLEALDLSENKLNTVNLTDASFQYLTKLRLTCNKLQWIGNLPPKLTALYIDHNNLSDVSFVSKLGHLRILDASNNNITKIPSKLFTNLKNLTCIFLWNNKIKDVAFLPNISGYNLYRIKLSYNEIEQVNVDFTKYGELRILEFNNNKISHFNFTGVKKVNHLDLCNNNISNITPTHPLRGSFITRFILCNNSLRNAAVIMLMTDLELLDLSNNNLEKVHKMFVKKKYLKELRLSNVTLQSLDFVKDLPELRKLEVDDNNITHLPKYLFKNISNFTLSNNPLERLYCPSNEDGKNITAYCKMRFKEENDNIILDIGMKNKEVNKNMECMLNNVSGKEFLKQCSSYSCGRKRNFKKYILVTIILILNIL